MGRLLCGMAAYASNLQTVVLLRGRFPSIGAKSFQAFTTDGQGGSLPLLAKDRDRC